MDTKTHTGTYVGLYGTGILKIRLAEGYLQVNSARTFVEFVGKSKKVKVACGAILALQPVGRLYPCPNSSPEAPRTT